MLKNSKKQKMACNYERSSGNANKMRKILFAFGIFAVVIALVHFSGVTAFANANANAGATSGTGAAGQAGGGDVTDPVAVIQNLGELIFSFVRIIGIILTGFGIMQVGISLKGHDPSQRASGFLCVAGGIIIALAKEILATIGFTL